MGVLRHCGRCRKTTAHVNDECQRCVFLKAYRKPMTDEAKARLTEANKRRKREREARKRDENSITEGS